jgi:hypothetical protein
MILGIQQDLKSEGIKVTISQLCRWFEVPTHQQGSCFCPVDFSVSIEQLFG